MRGSHPIVVGVDGSESAAPAVRWAARHARDTGGRLHLLYAAPLPDAATVVLPVPFGTRGGVLPRGPSSETILAAAAMLAADHTHGVDVSASVSPSTATQALVEASTHAQLIVVGSRRLGRLTGSLLGATGARVAANAHCPTVVVRAEGVPTGPVVVAVDDSPPTQPALRFAFAEAARRRSCLVAVHCWTPPVLPAGIGSEVAQSLMVGPARRELRSAAANVFTRVLAPWRAAFPDIGVQEWLSEGDPGTAVPHYADRAAMIVVGSHGTGPLSGLLTGSTSQALLHRADCPVIVIRTAEHRVGSCAPSTGSSSRQPA